MAGVSGAGMGRLMGFGFLFGARDDGATRTASEVRENIEGINTAAERSGGRAANGLRRLNAVIGSLQLGQLTRIGGALQNIAERAGAMSDVATSSVESWGAQASLSFRQASAGAGEFRAELESMRGSIMGTARGLDMDVQSLTRLNRGVLTAGTSLDELGLSQRELAGALQAGIIDAEGFGQSLREMRQGLGLSGEDIGSLLDEFTALGESVGEGEAFVRGIPGMLEGVREGLAEFPGLRRNSRQLLTDLGRLARGMQQVSGSTPEEALAATNQVFQTLIGSRRNLRDLFTGMGSDFDELATQLGISGAGVEGGLEMIMSRPAEFAVRAYDLFQQTGGAGTVMGDRLIGVLSRMGPQFLRLIDGSDESTAAIARMREGLGDTSGAFGRMARSASGSTRTFAENMERLRDNFSNSINTMLNRTRTARGEMRFDAAVLRAQREAYRNLTRRVQGYADSQSALGTATRLLLGTRRGGLVGLSVQLQRELQQFPQLQRAVREYLPVLGEFGSGALEVGQQIAPMLVAMRALNLRIPMLGGAMRLLFNPITLIAGGIYLLIRYWDRLEPMIERGSGIFRDFSRRILADVQNVDWEGMGRNLVDGIIMAFGVVGDMEGSSETTRAIAEGFRNIFSAAWTAIRGIIRGLWDRVIEWITEPENLGGRLRRGATAIGVVLAVAMFTPMRGPLIAGASRMFMWLGGRMVAMMGARGILGGTILRGGAAAGRGIGSLMGRLIGIPTSQALASSVQAAISGRGVTAAATRGAGGLFGRLGGAMSGVLGRGAGRALAGTALRSTLRAIPYVGAILGVLFDLPQIIQSFRTEGVVSGLNEVFGSILNGLLLGLPRLIDSLVGFDLFGTIFDTLFRMTGIGQIVERFQQGDWAGVIFEFASQGLPRIIREGVAAIAGEDLLAPLFGVWEQMIRRNFGLVMEFGGILWDTFTEIIGIFRDTFEPVWEALGLAFREISSIATDVFNELQPVFQEVFTELQGAFQEVAEVVQDVVFPLLQDLGAIFSDIWTEYAQPAFAAILRGYRVLFQQYIIPIGIRAFRALGRAVRWWWRNVTMPVLETLGRTFLRVATFIQDTGIAVFRTLADFVVSRFFDMIRGIVSMRSRWVWFRDTLVATSEAIRISIRNSLYQPLREAEDSLTNISDSITLTFSRLRLVVVDVVRGLMTAFRDAVQRIPIIGEQMAGPLNEAVSSLDTAFERQERAVEEMRRQQEAAARSRREVIDREAAAEREAWANVQRTYDEGRARVSADEEEVNRREREFRMRLGGLGDRLGIAIGTARERIGELFTAEGRAAARERRSLREQEARQQQLRDARRLVDVIGAERGLSRRERQAIAGAVVQAAEAGRAVDAEEVLRRVRAVEGRGAARQEAIGSVLQSLGVEPEEQRAAPAREEPRRRRGRARAAHAGRQQAREEVARAEVQELANELVIASFGEQAMRQLAQVFTIEIQGAGVVPPAAMSGQET